MPSFVFAAAFSPKNRHSLSGQTDIADRLSRLSNRQSSLVNDNVTSGDGSFISAGR
jgi:hypothetical protein